MYVFATLRFLLPSIDAKETTLDLGLAAALLSLKPRNSVWARDAFSDDIYGFWAVWLTGLYLLTGDWATKEPFLLLKASELRGKMRVSLAIAIVGVCLPETLVVAKPMNSLQVDSLFRALIDSPWWCAIALWSTWALSTRLWFYFASCYSLTSEMDCNAGFFVGCCFLTPVLTNVGVFGISFVYIYILERFCCGLVVWLTLLIALGFFVIFLTFCCRLMLVDVTGLESILSVSIVAWRSITQCDSLHSVSTRLWAPL